jgi:hypothetical protein
MRRATAVMLFQSTQAKVSAVSVVAASCRPAVLSDRSKLCSNKDTVSSAIAIRHKQVISRNQKIAGPVAASQSIASIYSDGHRRHALQQVESLGAPHAVSRGGCIVVRSAASTAFVLRKLSSRTAAAQSSADTLDIHTYCHHTSSRLLQLWTVASHKRGSNELKRKQA